MIFCEGDKMCRTVVRPLFVNEQQDQSGVEWYQCELEVRRQRASHSKGKELVLADPPGKHIGKANKLTSVEDMASGS
jgi:hypothetical protein